jgi:hypothetical protein
MHENSVRIVNAVFKIKSDTLLLHVLVPSEMFERTIRTNTREECRGLF